MNIEIFTKIQTKEFIIEEFKKLEEKMFAELNVLRQRILKLEEQ